MKDDIIIDDFFADVIRLKEQAEEEKKDGTGN